MIPEAGDRNEFKAALLQQCSTWPRVGERYLADWGERRVWTVVRLDGDGVHFIGHPGGLPDYISYGSWEAYRRDFQGSLKYVGNDS